MKKAVTVTRFHVLLEKGQWLLASDSCQRIIIKRMIPENQLFRSQNREGQLNIFIAELKKTHMYQLYLEQTSPD